MHGKFKIYFLKIKEKSEIVLEKFRIKLEGSNKEIWKFFFESKIKETLEIPIWAVMGMRKNEIFFAMTE